MSNLAVTVERKVLDAYSSTSIGPTGQHLLAGLPSIERFRTRYSGYISTTQRGAENNNTAETSSRGSFDPR
jgi:hypothetical protein